MSTTRSTRARSSSGTSSAPAEPWTQWTGQRRVAYVSAGLRGLTTVAVSANGRLPGWLAAKEMWSGGCQSRVATRVARAGRARRALMVGTMSRPPGTAREPFWEESQSATGSSALQGRVNGELTGGQKSSCMSTTISAGLKASGAISRLRFVRDY